MQLLLQIKEIKLNLKKKSTENKNHFIRYYLHTHTHLHSHGHHLLNCQYRSTHFSFVASIHRLRWFCCWQGHPSNIFTMYLAHKQSQRHNNSQIHIHTQILELSKRVDARLYFNYLFVRSCHMIFVLFFCSNKNKLLQFDESFHVCALREKDSFICTK